MARNDDVRITAPSSVVGELVGPQSAAPGSRGWAGVSCSFGAIIRVGALVNYWQGDRFAQGDVAITTRR